MKNVKFYEVCVLIVSVLASCGDVPTISNEISLDFTRKGAEVNPQMYGIFFEEINHSGDGALYAELIRNRNFEEAVIPSGTTYRDGYVYFPHSKNYNFDGYSDWKVEWRSDSLKMIGWSVKGLAEYDVVSDNPLHSNTPNAMKLQMKEPGVVLQNEGYWGLPVVSGDKYDLRFYVNALDYQGKVTAKIISRKGEILSETLFEIKRQGTWNEYTSVITSSATDTKGAFQLVFDAPGTVYVDYVSLFPQKTFKNRKNGMRQDVAQALADLKPGFLRWPGGCIVEGAGYENRVKWKETLGDPMQRRSEWILWNYHCTWGFGYHEFLQFCEDIGAAPMFVANVGLACTLRNGDFTNDLGPVIQDIQDAIEYAQGDVNTVWGAKRAAAGHPKPFKLKYIELGNEQVGDFYAERFNYLYSLLKTQYPEITFICTLGLDKSLEKVVKADMIDPHWYVNPNYFYENDRLFDKVERGKYDIYVGEYACNMQVGTGNMDGALSEAAFISGMERNGDIVKIASYAPLLENHNHRDWPTNLIWVNTEGVVGRTSYYVQKMYSNNVPTYNIETKLQEILPTPFNGFVGLVGDSLSAQYRNIKIASQSGEILLETNDFSNFRKLEDNLMRRRWMPLSASNILESLKVEKGVLELEVRAVNIPRPMRQDRRQNTILSDSMTVLPAVIFGADEACKNYFTLNLGSQGEKSVINIVRTIEGVQGFNRNLEGPKLELKPGEWYKIKIKFADDDRLICSVNGSKVLEQKVSYLSKHYVISGYDSKTGETIIKVINGTVEPYTAQITLNCEEVEKRGRIITLSADSLKEENSFEEPLKIAPIESEYNNFSKKFVYKFAPCSFTIMRIKTTEK